MKKLMCLSLLVCSCAVFSQSDVEEKPKENKSSGVFKKGRSVASVSYGLPNSIKKMYVNNFEDQLFSLRTSHINTDASISYSVKGVGPFFFKVEAALADWFGIGPVFAYSQSTIAYKFLNPEPQSGTFVIKSTNTNLNTYKTQSFIFGLRNNFHFGKNDKIDHYIGLGLGYNLVSSVASEEYSNKFIKEPYYYDHLLKNRIPDIIGDPTSPLYFSLTFGVRQFLTNTLGINLEFGIDHWSYIQLGLVIRTK
jgi:hypothetical protein